MKTPKLPKAWVQAGQKEVKARVDMSAEVAGKGLCPECRQQMTTAIVNGHESLVCHEDRIAIPVADIEETPAETPQV